MKKNTSLRVALLAFITSSAFAGYECCEGPLDACRWFVKPKIGVAPTIFASHRAHQQFVVPLAGVDTSSDCSGGCNVDFFNRVLQEGQCLPKFSDMFRQGVLHVGFEIGYNICDRSPWFLEFIYNRASGRCFCFCDPFITNRANIGCSKNCDFDCDFPCQDNCCPTGDTLSEICSVTDDYDDYQAYGGYIGGRYFSDPFWCDTTAFWFGYKVGIIHRRRIDACTTFCVPEELCSSENNFCEQDQQQICIDRAIFCRSNSVSGGIQLGFDYCYNDCLSFQLGFEVVASCGLRGNKNHPINLDDIKNSSGSTSLKNSCRLPSNIIVCNTGAVVNFPIWFGLRWEFGGCCDDPCPAC